MRLTAGLIAVLLTIPSMSAAAQDRETVTGRVVAEDTGERTLSIQLTLSRRQRAGRP